MMPKLVFPKMCINVNSDKIILEWSCAYIENDDLPIIYMRKNGRALSC
jgi:hypothetical protein